MFTKQKGNAAKKTAVGRFISSKTKRTTSSDVGYEDNNGTVMYPVVSSPFSMSKEDIFSVCLVKKEIVKQTSK